MEDSYMKTNEYVKTSLFKKFNECTVLSRNRETSASVNTEECLKTGQLVLKDVQSISKPLAEAVASTNTRLSVTLEPQQTNDFNQSFLRTQRYSNSISAESVMWQKFEEPNAAYLASIGYVRVSPEPQKPPENSPMVMLAGLLVALFWLYRMPNSKDKTKAKNVKEE